MKKKVEEGVERRGRGWLVERESSERTQMKRIKMEEKTIAMEGGKGNGKVKIERRKRRNKDGERAQRVDRRRRGASSPWSQTAQMASWWLSGTSSEALMSFKGQQRWWIEPLRSHERTRRLDGGGYRSALCRPQR